MNAEINERANATQGQSLTEESCRDGHKPLEEHCKWENERERKNTQTERERETHCGRETSGRCLRRRNGSLQHGIV